MCGINGKESWEMKDISPSSVRHHETTLITAGIAIARKPTSKK